MQGDPGGASEITRHRARIGALHRRRGQFPDRRGASRTVMDAAPWDRVDLSSVAGPWPHGSPLPGARSTGFRNIEPGQHRASPGHATNLGASAP